MQMVAQPADSVFAGSVPETYDRYLVPLIFQPYAEDLAGRVAARGVTSLLEVACGTGVVTRELARRLASSVDIVATDLNQAMIDQATRVGTTRPVRWQPADAMSLPFEDGSFDAVVCQFGVMFFPDRRTAYREVARVLRPGGAFLFNVWDSLAENPLTETAHNAVGTCFPDDPPQFFARTPHGYHDQAVIQSDLEAAGFRMPANIEVVDAVAHAPSAEHAARGICQGSPLRNEILARDPEGLPRATEAAAAAIRLRHGDADVTAAIRALVVEAGRP